MLVQTDCYKCILNQCADMAKDAGIAPEKCNTMLQRYIRKFAEIMDYSTPPEVAEALFAIHREVTGIDDPYREIKIESTKLALQLFDEFASIVAQSSDPLLTALRIAAGGNVIDYGVNPDFKLENAAGLIRETVNMPMDMKTVEILREKLSRAENVLYILDNCGEAVFDRLLIDVIGAGKVTIAVRGGAILNDITRSEVEISRLGDLKICDTGSRTPGVSMKNSAPEFLDLIRNADVAIAKGQGNFESLYGEKGFDDLFFLFRVKCRVLTKFAGVELNTLQLKRNIS